MMKKVGAVILEIVLIFSCLFMPITNAKAGEAKEWIICDESVPFESETLTTKINTISHKISVIINGEKNYLYPAFDDKETALHNIKTEAVHVLSELADKYGMDELSSENWEQYRNAVQSYDNIEYQSEKIILQSFIDIYENDIDNEAILNCLANANTLEEVKDELFYSLPYTTPYFIEMSNMRANQPSTYSYFYVDYAIRYARDYGYSPNTNYVYFGENDCTNFASQIMLAGGMEMDGSGWYYQSNPTMYSKGWTVANNFARYWGVNYTTSSHYNFSKYLQAGDFIMGDWDGDGHWDHAGFVIQSDNYQTDGYFDYLVAQHSDNYIAWATSNTNGWDLTDGKYIYGVIRK